MRRPHYTYFELSADSGRHYYAVITSRGGHSFYVSGFNSRSAAYRFAKRHLAQGRWWCEDRRPAR